MANSSHFQELERRIRELRKHLLPNAFSSTGTYTERVHDRARGFRVLVHAEIEAYLEEMAAEIVGKKIKEWDTSSKPSYAIISLLAAYHAGWVMDENEESIFSPDKRKKPKEKIQEIVTRAHEQYRATIIGQNNGIKVDDLKAIFLPLGVDFDTVDQTWLANMNTYGTDRGKIAHQAKRAQTQIDPKTEKDTVYALKAGIKEFDKALMRISTL